MTFHDGCSYFFCSAYATVSGMHSLLRATKIIENKCELRWLIGLDDFLTQPDVLRRCKQMQKSSIRIASRRKEGSLFHPKVYVRTGAALPSACLVGSSNMTFRGLNKNIEASAFISEVAGRTASGISSLVSDLWGSGKDITDDEIEGYDKLFEKRRVTQSHEDVDSPEEVKAILESDKSLLSPQNATVCWIELGYNTARGREIEIKQEQAMFFHLPINPPPQMHRDFVFIVSSGRQVSLTLKFQENEMWRIQINRDVPECGSLRLKQRDGTLKRSPYAAVMKRESQGKYTIRFMELSSKEFSEIKETSKSIGAFGRTTARCYGWY